LLGAPLRGTVAMRARWRAAGHASVPWPWGAGARR